MAYVDELSKISRTPTNLVKIEMIHCGLTFGTSPCEGSGNPCYQTYKTCKDKSHFSWTNTVNLLPNGEFNTIDGWIMQTGAGSSGYVELSPGGYSGKCLKLGQLTTLSGTQVTNYEFSFTPGATYTMTLHMKGSTNVGSIDYGIGTPNVAWTTYATAAITTSWSTLSIAFTASTNSKDVIIGRNSSLVGYILIDDVRITGQYAPDVSKKTYSYVSNDAPLPLMQGERPYVKQIKYLPVEIKENITVGGRAYVDFYDEPDSDYDLDPNYSIRDASASTRAFGKSYFKKLFARYDNWYNRTIEIYEGFSVATNLSSDNFSRKFVGKIKEVKIDDNIVKVEAVDLLESMRGISYPSEAEVELKNAMSAGATLIKVRDFGDIPSTGGYLRIEDEIVRYSTVGAYAGGIIPGQSTLILGKKTKQLRGVTRALFMTTATSHKKKTKAQLCALIGPDNPFDILQDILLEYSSMPSTSVNTAAFEAMKTYPGRECKFVTLLTQPTRMEELYQEILKMTESRSWIDENQQITIGRGFLRNSTLPWAEIKSSANIIQGSENMNYAVDQGITHGLLFWDRGVLADDNEASGHNRLSMQTDTMIESLTYHGKRVEERIYDRWLHTSLSYPASQIGESSVVETEDEETTNLYDPANVEIFAEGMISRFVNWRSQAKRVYDIELELKDATIQTGEQILFNSDLFLDSSGVELTKARCFVAKKESKDWDQKMTLEDYGKWTALIAPDGQASYTTSMTATDLVYGYMSDTNGNLGDGSPGYVIY